MPKVERDWTERPDDLDDIDCLSGICPRCGSIYAHPDCGCGYIYGGESEADPATADAEKIFQGDFQPKRSSQSSQCSHAPDIGLEDMIEGAADPAADELAAHIKVVEDAIAACKANPGALASSAFNEACAYIRQHSPEDWMVLRVRLKKEKPSGVLLGDIDKASRPEGEGGDDSTIADELVQLAMELGELSHDKEDRGFLTTRAKPVMTFAIDTKGFERFLSYAFYRKTRDERGDGRPGIAANETAMRTARSALAGVASHEGPEVDVFLRAAPWANGYVIDLGDDQGRVIEVLPTGWRVLEESPVKFWRPNSSRPLPLPAPGGNLDDLWKFCNIPEESRPLVMAWMLEAMRPETPFPILALCGSQGSAKSSTQSKLRRMIDPNAVNLRAAPKSTEDVYVGAGCNWLVSFENLSHLSPQMQDALCTLATGGGFAARTLFTNAEETLIEAKRPVVINSIPPVVTAQDLTDRVIHVELPTIEYREEAEIEAAFSEALPGIFGALLDLMVGALKQLPNATLTNRRIRMADFARFGEAMTLHQGREPGTFCRLFEANRKESVARGLDASPVANAVRELAEAERSDLVFEGTMKRLLERLNGLRPDGESWPKSPRGLGDALRRQAPALAAIGVHVSIGKPGRDGVPVTIRKAREHREHREHGFARNPHEKKNHGDAEVF